MEKLKMETPSGAQELFAKLAKLVPECVVEKQSDSFSESCLLK